MRLRPSLCLLANLALVSCIHRDTIDAPETATEEGNATVAISGTTAIQSSTSGVRMQLWRPAIDTGVASFWPSGARRVQVLTSAGDAGDRSTGGLPTTYVWIVKDGATIYKAWRVVTAQMTGPTGFTARLNQAVAVAEGGVDTGASWGMQGMVKRPGGWGGPIGPGGGGDPTAAAVDDVLAAAAQL